VDVATVRLACILCISGILLDAMVDLDGECGQGMMGMMRSGVSNSPAYSGTRSDAGVVSMMGPGYVSAIRLKPGE
jgi:hypothetical protein